MSKFQIIPLRPIRRSLTSTKFQTMKALAFIPQYCGLVAKATNDQKL